MTSDDEELRDTSQPGFDIFAKFSLAVDNLANEIRKQNAREQARLAMLPIYIPFSQMALGANGTNQILDFGGPQNGREWIVRLLVATPSPITQYPVTTVTQTSNTFTAASAGSVSLTAGAYITGFDVNFQAPAAAVSTTVTVTNVSGGTMSYNVSIPTTGYALSVRYPNADAAASAVVAPTVNVPAITGGPAYSITVYGETIQYGPAITWYVGQNIGGPAAGQLPQTMARWQVQDIPAYEKFTSDVIRVGPNEHLMAGLTQIASGLSVVCTAIVKDQPIAAASKVVSVE